MVSLLFLVAIEASDFTWRRVRLYAIGYLQLCRPPSSFEFSSRRLAADAKGCQGAPISHWIILLPFNERRRNNVLIVDNYVFPLIKINKSYCKNGSHLFRQKTQLGKWNFLKPAASAAASDKLVLYRRHRRCWKSQRLSGTRWSLCKRKYKSYWKRTAPH